MKREIVKINEDLCNGCGLCIPNCHEGALQLIDGKARLISDLLCDGLGACIGHCPEGAINIEEREAEPYDEIKVIQDMVKKGANTVKAHLMHLKDHMEFGYLKEGVRWLMDHKAQIDYDVESIIEKVHKGEEVKNSCGCGNDDHHADHAHSHAGGACPGSKPQSFKNELNDMGVGIDQTSALTHWPVQMHLINPASSFFKGADLLLAADCVAYSLGNFHSRYLPGKALCIACPKLDSNKESYVEKIQSLIEDSEINTITVMKMEVPCCSGIIQFVQLAQANAGRKVPLKVITVSTKGEILSEEWL